MVGATARVALLPIVASMVGATLAVALAPNCCVYGRGRPYEPLRSPYVDAGPGGGLVGNTIGERGDWLKSKSDSRLPRMEASSRTSGRGSGRPSVLVSRRWLFRKSSSMNFRYASKLSVW